MNDKTDHRRPVLDARCVRCRVVIKGAMLPDGTIRPTDRPYSDDPPQEVRALCVGCARPS